jgi:hypothetical protein
MKVCIQVIFNKDTSMNVGETAGGHASYNCDSVLSNSFTALLGIFEIIKIIFLEGINP